MTDEQNHQQQDDEIIDNDTEQKSSRDSWYGLKKFAYTMLALLIVFVVFGQVMPMLMGFDRQETAKPEVVKEQIVQKPEIKTTENLVEKSAEVQAEIPAEVSAEVSAEKPAETVAEVAKTEELKPAITPEATPEVKKIDDEKLQLLEAKIAQQDAAISELKTKLETQLVQSSTTQIAVEKQAQNTLSALVVFGQMKESVLRGEAYSSQLNQLKTLIENNEKIEKIVTELALKADTGIVPVSELNIQFATLAKQAMASGDSDDNSAWNYTRILHKFIAIRKVGEQSGTSDEAVLARAEIRLQKGDLLSALTELSELSAPAKEVFSVWSTKAQEFLDTRSNLDKLQLLITQKNLESKSEAAPETVTVP